MELRMLTLYALNRDQRRIQHVYSNIQLSKLSNLDAEEAITVTDQALS